MAPHATTERVHRTPTGPRGTFLLGALPEIRRDPLGFLVRTRAQHGDVARYRLGPMDTYLVAHPEGLRRVLQENVANYTKDHPMYGVVRWIAGNGLLTSMGDFWLRQRRLAQPAFHRPRIAAMATAMSRATGAMLERWDEIALEGRPLSVTHEMMGLTLTIVSEVLFGTDVGARVEQVGRAFDVVTEQLANRFRTFRLIPPVLPTPYDAHFRRARRALVGTVDEIIAQRRRSPAGHHDLLSLFMEATDEETGARMDDAQLRDEVLTMMLAGHETTATTMSWVWTLLDAHPEAEARLHSELDTVLGGRVPTMEDIPKLTWTRQVVEESMRLYPPAYIFSRRVVADDEIGGFRIPAGAAIDISPYLTHRHPELWDAPDDFRPERFAPEASGTRHRFAFIPFSNGPRQCIGNTFALVEAQIILAMVASRWRLRRTESGPVRPEPLITLRPAGSLPMRLERRRATDPIVREGTVFSG